MKKIKNKGQAGSELVDRRSQHLNQDGALLLALHRRAAARGPLLLGEPGTAERPPRIAAAAGGASAATEGGPAEPAEAELVFRGRAAPQDAVATLLVVVHLWATPKAPSSLREGLDEQR